MQVSNCSILSAPFDPQRNPVSGNTANAFRLKCNLRHLARSKYDSFLPTQLFGFVLHNNGTVPENSCRPEHNCNRMLHIQMNPLGYSTADTFSVADRNNRRIRNSLPDKSRSCSSCFETFIGNMIHQVMDMQYIAAGKYTRDTGGKEIIDKGA